MIKIIKKDLDLLFRSKSFYFAFILIAFFAFIIPFFANFVASYAGQSATYKSDPFLNSWSAVITPALMLCTSIFGITIINKENKQGYVKNFAGMYYNKGLFAISKFITISIAVVIWAIFGFCATLIATNLIASNIEYSDLTHFICIYGLGIFLNISTVSVLVFMTVLTRNNFPAIILGILISSNIYSFLLTAVNQGVNKLLGTKDFLIESYLPYESIAHLDYNPASSAIIKAVIVGIVFIVVFNILSVIVSNKRDIK